MAHYLENIFHWLAVTNFEWKPGLYLVPSGKDTKYYQIIKLFQDKFKDHSHWNDNDWKKSTHAWFMKKCKREHIVDPDTEEVRKSVPLYKDLTSNKHQSCSGRGQFTQFLGNGLIVNN